MNPNQDKHTANNKTLRNHIPANQLETLKILRSRYYIYNRTKIEVRLLVRNNAGQKKKMKSLKCLKNELSIQNSVSFRYEREIKTKTIAERTYHQKLTLQ